MATIAGANTTTLTETIPTESINGLVLPPANLIRVYQAFTWQCPATGAKHVFPQIVAAAVTGTQTETDEFTATDLETVKEEISPAMIGKRSFHSDQVDLEGSILTPQARVNAMADEVENRIDKDVLGLFVGATGTDKSGSNLSLDFFDEALAAFLVQALDRKAQFANGFRQVFPFGGQRIAAAVPGLTRGGREEGSVLGGLGRILDGDRP